LGAKTYQRHHDGRINYAMCLCRGIYIRPSRQGFTHEEVITIYIHGIKMRF